MTASQTMDLYETDKKKSHSRSECLIVTCCNGDYRGYMDILETWQRHNMYKWHYRCALIEK